MQINPNSCYYHPNLPAMMVCYRCGRKICTACSKDYNGLTMCPSCYHNVPPPMPAAIPAGVPAAVPGAMPAGAPMPVGGPVGGMRPAGWYGPYMQPPLLTRLWWLPLSLVGAAAALILLNAAALLSPAFFALWSAFLPWVSVFGTFGFILGIVLGLVLLGAIAMVFLKFRIFAVFLIFPTAVISLFIGGGFIIGAVLAVIGGILLLLT